MNFDRGCFPLSLSLSAHSRMSVTTAVAAITADASCGQARQSSSCLESYPASSSVVLTSALCSSP